jgi:hypothetical protein
MSQEFESNLLSVIEAPEVYIDGYQGAMLANGVVKMNCFTVGIDPTTSRPFQKVAVRLTIPLQSFVDIHAAMGELIKNIRENGVEVPQATGTSNG